MDYADREKRLLKPLAITAAVLGATFLVDTAAQAASPEYMMAKCRARAHELLRTRLPNIETKYEGQRTDGTHAVNGTAYVGDFAENFQCSFNRQGRRIVNFTVAHVGRPGSGGGTSAESGDRASGDINCAEFDGQPFGRCKFVVIRQGNGTATVRITFQDGNRRTLHFRNGKAVSSDRDAGIYTERQSDLNTVYVGSGERYEIPDALVYGG
jgi:hypothetical protein